MYHLFSGRAYYPNGGMSDYQGSFDSLDEARNHFDSLIGRSVINDDWAQVAHEHEGRLQLIQVWAGEWLNPDWWRKA